MKLSRLLLASILVLASHKVWPAPIPIKVVVVTMYQPGKNPESDPGEFRLWIKGEDLNRVLPFPVGETDIRMNDRGVLGIMTGVGTAKAAAAVMALGLDPRFDLSNAYWLVAGIAGGDPADVSLASAVWVDWVVDGDLAYELDGREIPADWPTGFVPLGKDTPYENPAVENFDQVFDLNPKLLGWAYARTRNLKLPETDIMRTRRAQFNEPAARRPPFVTVGSELSASTYWHGRLMSQWANAWVHYYTGGKGNYAVSAMEDTGTLESLERLARAGRVDFSRVLVLRTVSNYDQQRPGDTAAGSLTEQHSGKYSAWLPSLESAFEVGHVVVEELVRDWGTYRDQPPVDAPGAEVPK